MKLLLDQGLPRSAAGFLQSWGVDCVHAGQVGLSCAEDAAILDRARAESRVVVTLDADFHRLMALSGAAQPSVVRLRVQGLRGKELAHLLQRVLDRCRTALEAGAVVSVRDHHVRVRKLPLRPAL